METVCDEVRVAEAEQVKVRVDVVSGIGDEIEVTDNAKKSSFELASCVELETNANGIACDE